MEELERITLKKVEKLRRLRKSITHEELMDRLNDLKKQVQRKLRINNLGTIRELI